MPDAAGEAASSKLPRAGVALAVLAALFWLVALGVLSLTRERRFTADSRNYVNVAKNVLEGRGLVQDTAGFGEGRFPTKARLPQPYGVHGPLFPLAIAGLAAVGLPAEDAALLIPVFCAGLTLAGAVLLLRRLYDRETALWGAGLLVASYPLAFLARTAWSELLAMAALFGSLLLLLAASPRVGARPPSRPGRGAWPGSPLRRAIPSRWPCPWGPSPSSGGMAGARTCGGWSSMAWASRPWPRPSSCATSC